ncbi:MFS general substrate transporter [Dothidotthia symphoricarpi CBS 119687]|uniref:MFS general substrate transporter n=1 Tax=Dothidotthia symphoricarpi CBS 119687 TaxID=1392245 RepID=A0A6A5ZZY8_9PLEO|nr:MFS general substrate transporter [Dothidotthia symphoricarpi CBS 119687]KAF2124474.1 MFS general substrate transporter [Dothidotthia symphoricarpi CBS 119687]
MTEHKLPVQQLAILSICRFAEPIALTSVFPYLPEMMESFGIPQNDIARWAGITSTIFSMCQASTALLWGAASDRIGRKPIILLGLFNTMWTMLMWGFSTNLPMALTARALQGLGNGNVGILRTTVAELCPWKELQPRAFSIMPLVYTVGAIFGPMLGGAMSNPLRVNPRRPRGDAFLEKFPYVLPNIVAAAFFTIGIVVGWLFLQESLENKKGRQDLGLRTGTRLVTSFRKIFCIPKTSGYSRSEQEPLLGPQKAMDSLPTGEATSIVKQDSPKVRDVLSYQTTLNLVVYTLLALYSIAFDQLLPVFMHHPSQSTNDTNVSLPLKFSGGFGIDSRRIGAIFTLFGVTSTLCQFLLFPPLARTLGVLRCLRISFHIFPVVYFVTPFVSLIPDQTTKEVVLVALLMIRGVAGTFAFPTSTIMLTNSAPSLRLLGTINGVATSVSAIGRAIGPAVGGGLFTWGVKRGYVIVPFWALSAISLLASIPTWWLVEGKGFGDDADSDTESIASSTEEESEAENARPMSISKGDEALDSESEFGEVGEPRVSRTHSSPRSSTAWMPDDNDGDDSDEESNVGRRRHPKHVDSARRRRTLERTSSVPIGMGRGFRRYSSNLGSTGVGGSGTSWGGT